jgi:transcriptional regulator with GAF, ATPase, and Fis domain
LKKEGEAGRFRQDLYYRLSVFPIEIPPLRDQREDLVSMISHFIEKCAERMNCPARRLTQATMDSLLAYDWPGNVRELQNAVERAVILAQGGPLRFEFVTPAVAKVAPPSASLPPLDSPRLMTREDIRRHERECIAAALKQTSGKIFGPGGAAELQATKPTTLASRIKALGLARKPKG